MCARSCREHAVAVVMRNQNARGMLPVCKADGPAHVQSVILPGKFLPQLLGEETMKALKHRQC